MEIIDLVVVIPVGPKLRYDFVIDTIESVKFFTRSEYRIIVVDDSREDVGSRLKEQDQSLHVIRTQGAQGVYGGLYAGTSSAFAYALQHFQFSTLLRLDTDALVIGPDSDQEAKQYFSTYPDVGVLGSYRIGCDGVARDFTPPKRRLQYEISLPAIVLEPKHYNRYKFLREVVKKATQHGYEFGEHCLASAVFYRYECIASLASYEYLNREELRSSRLGDDHLFGLLTLATGYRIADFATNNLPIGVRWRGLPFSPQELLDRRKKITHSTRFWDNMDEDDVRAFFRNARTKQVGA